MASVHSFSTDLSLLFLFLNLFSLICQSVVPPENQFTYVNEGDFGDYVIEYDGNYRALPPFNAPFQLCFYNTTPNAYTLALRIGLVRHEALFRWVWEANRGNPVRENATLSLAADGNLVLADADGRIAWQTNTANIGVVGLQVLPNGNMVLHDASSNFLWQSFDSPTDTLLVGQSLRARGASKLISRDSELVNSDGPYSLVLEPKRLAMYYKSSKAPKPMIYFSGWISVDEGTLVNLTFNSEPETEEGYAYYLKFDYHVANPSSKGNRYIARPKFNSTLTLLRLGLDGNIRFYTYYNEVDDGPWEVVYTLFDRDSREGECQLPGRCGNLGLCEDNQCVACPSPKGLLGWSKECEATKVSCRPNDFQYYTLEGVDHFMSKYTRGDATKETDCESKCTKDCKCLGYFYHGETSRCWIAYDLKTLTKVGDKTHLGYIKAPKNQPNPGGLGLSVEGFFFVGKS